MKKDEMLPTLQESYNVRWYIQHFIHENEYQYDGDEWTHNSVNAI